MEFFDLALEALHVIVLVSNCSAEWIDLRIDEKLQEHRTFSSSNNVTFLKTQLFDGENEDKVNF